MKLDPRELSKVNVQRLEAELVYRHDSILGESPLWEEREQRLYWVDIDRGHIHRFDPVTRRNESFQLPDKVTSIGRRTGSGLIASLRKNLAYFDTERGKVQVLDAVETDLPENRFNDGKCDRQGRFWPGSMNEVHVGRPDGALYRFMGPGAIAKKISDVTISNGTGWSVDGTAMYYTDTLRFTVFVYDFDPASGELENPRPFLELEPAANGLPDGLTVDIEGFVWSALVNFGCMLRLDPSGQLERIVTLPATRGTCCTFGGADYSELYITTARECLTAEAISRQPLAGSLFCCQPGVHGLAETPFVF